MSIRQNFPTTQPSLVLDFANSKTLDPRITFARSQTTSNGSTYTGPDGLVKYAGADEPRFDHKYENGVVKSLGLLIEESRSNLIGYSTISTVAGWSISGSTVTDNATTAPDGTNTAARIQATGDYVSVLSIPVTAGQTYTFSFWVKSVSGSGTWGVNWYEGVTGHNRTTVNVTEEWERVSITFTPTQTQINVYVSDNREGLATISDAYVWGAQLEKGSFKTTLIPTEGSTKTRSAEGLYIGGEDFQQFYNPIEGTIFTSFSTLYEGSQRTGTTPGVFGISQTQEENSLFNGYGLALRSDTRLMSFAHRVINGEINSNISLLGDITPTTIQPNTKYEISCSYANNELARSIDGNSVATRDDSNYGILPKTTLFIGFQRFGGSPPYELTGHISKLTYYPVRLTNTQLQNLTK